MSFSNGFRGTAGGSVQANVTDQPGMGVNGMLAFASDLNFCDNYIVAETNGIRAGAGVVSALFTAADYDLQRPNEGISLPITTSAIADFAGIVVFDEGMQSDENGVPGIATRRIARVLRPTRVGGRVYVHCKAAVTKDSTIHLCTLASGVYVAGDLCPADLGAGNSISLANVARWTHTTTAAGLVIVEMRYAG